MKPYTSKKQTPNSILSLLVLLITACSPGSMELQQFEPTRDVSLPDILEQVPVIKYMVDNMDPKELDARVSKNADALTEYEIEVQIKDLMKITEILREPAPKLLNSLAHTVDGIHMQYLHDREDFNTSFSFIERLTETSGEKLADILYILAASNREQAEQTDRFESALTLSLPSMQSFKDCSDSATMFGSLTQSVRDYNDLETDRRELLESNASLHPIYCAFKNGNETIAESKADFIREFLQADAVDNPDAAAALERSIADAEHNIIKTTEDEKTLADWLVAEPLRAAFVDWLIEHGLVLLKNEHLFDRPLFDRTAGFFTGKNPNTNSYVLREVFDDIESGIDEIRDVDNAIADVASNSALISYVDDLMGGTSASIKSSIESYGGGNYNNGREGILDMLWDGRTYNHNSPAVATTWNDGLLKPPATEIELESSAKSTFRLDVHDVLNGDNDGKLYGSAFDSDAADGDPSNPYGGLGVPISTDYEEETPGEAFGKNLGLYFTENFYSVQDKRWAFGQGDSVDFFDNPDRNLARAFHMLQYSLRNLVVLDDDGQDIGEAGFEDLSLLTRFLYSSALGAGMVDTYFSSKQAYFRNALRVIDGSVSGSNVADDGVAATGIPLDTIRLPLFCNGGTCNNTSGSVNHVIKRNGTTWIPNLFMPAYELLTPGRFLVRGYSTYDGTETFLHNSYYGAFSAHQGDVDNANFRTGGVINSMVAHFGFLGHGPYSYRGKAPNGSKVKYDSDYFTDTYATSFSVLRSTGFACLGTTDATLYLAMGNNMGEVSHGIESAGGIFECGADDWADNKFRNGNNHTWLTRSASGVADSRFARKSAGATGNLHVYERIYRPKSSSDPCWNDATENGSYNYPRYGYVRPSVNYGYNNNNNCGSWTKIKIDFDSRDEAIKANVRFLIEYKKLTLVIPQAGADRTVLCVTDCAGVSIAAFVIQQANGLLGLLRAKPVHGGTSAGEPVLKNGAWNAYASTDMLNANGGGGSYRKVPNGSTGLAFEGSLNGATATSRFARTSFAARDSGVTVLYTAAKWGSIVVGDVFGQPGLGESIMAGVGTHPAGSDREIANINPLETIFGDYYDSSEVVASGFSVGDESFLKFKDFYGTYLSEDRFNADGETGADGTPDIFQKYERSLTYPGCKESNQRIRFCLTASQMPPVPRVNGVRYPYDFNADGSVDSWYTHTKSSDGKFDAALTLMALAAGTDYESRKRFVRDSGTGKCAFTTSVTNQQVSPPCRVMTANDNPDNVVTMAYARNEYKSVADHHAETDVLPILNESVHDSAYHPAYNPNALANILVESTPGQRDGLLPRIFSSNLLHFPSLEQELNGLLDELLAKFKLAVAAQTGQLSTIDKIRYFLTGEVSGSGKQFTSNALDGISGEPFLWIREIIGALRKAGEDTKTREAISKLIAALNSLQLADETGDKIDIDEETILKFFELIYARNNSGEYVIDALLQKLTEATFYPDGFELDTFVQSLKTIKAPFDDLNAKVIAIFGADYDLRKKILYGNLISEPFADHNADGEYTDGEPYYDANENGRHDSAELPLHEFYTDTVNDYTDTDGTYMVTGRLPNFFNLDSIDMFGLTKTQAINAPSPEPIERDDLVEVFDFFEDPSFYQDVIGDEISDSLDNDTVVEPTTDLNDDGFITSGEFDDIDGDGTVSEVSIRTYLNYLADSYHDFYSENIDDLELGLQTVDTLLDPNCMDYDSNTGCTPNNSNYLTASAFVARGHAAELLDPEEVAAIRRLASGLLYDTDNDNYRLLMTKISQGMLPIKKIQRGDEEFSREQLIESFEQNGVMHYIVERLELGHSFTEYDLMRDIQTLMTIKQIREYDHEGTVWYETADLLEDLSGKAYRQYNQDFELDSEYFSNFSTLFKK